MENHNASIWYLQQLKKPKYIQEAIRWTAYKELKTENTNLRGINTLKVVESTE